MTTAIQPGKDTTQHLLDLRQQLAAFNTLSCRLVHEQALELVTSPVPLQMDLSEVRVQRKGLCTPATRRKTLGCAHTTANDKFAHLADKVHATGVLGDVPLPSSTLMDITMRIYLMDVEKGVLDKRYLLASKSGDTAEATSLKNNISQIVERHTTAIAELTAYREYLLGSIDGWSMVDSP